MNIVLAPDSFKGSLDAPHACAAMEAGLRRVWPTATVRARPMADGGEGTLDAILHASGGAAARDTLRVPGAGGADVDAAVGLLRECGAQVAFIEVAQVVGITDAAAMDVDVGARSTAGIGVLMRALLDRGVRDFRVGLGGSSTNDGGAGMLAALGVRLLDAHGDPVDATPDCLARLDRIDVASVDPRLAEARITVLSDVDNPLCGASGATMMFGPQKGVPQSRLREYDRTLERYAQRAEAAFGRDVARQGSAGAAGGLGFALQLLGAEVACGADVVADLIGLDAAIVDAAWVITGEGRSDAQTLRSKAPFIVAQRARRGAVPVTLVSGAIDPASLPALGMHFAGCFGLPHGPSDLAACVANASAWLADRVEQVARVFAAGRHGAHARAAL